MMKKGVHTHFLKHYQIRCLYINLNIPDLFYKWDFFCRSFLSDFY